MSYSTVPSEPGSGPSGIVPGRVLVQYKSESAAQVASKRHGLERATVAASGNGRSTGRPRVENVEVPPGRDTQDLIDELNADPKVELAGPATFSQIAYTATPDDPAFNDTGNWTSDGQLYPDAKGWWIDDQAGSMRTSTLWPSLEVGGGPGHAVAHSSEITIATIDTGFYMTHPDKGSNIVAGWDYFESFSNAGGYITDGDVTPVPESAPLNDLNTAAHGTCVAGQVGAATDNGAGVASVGYDNTVTVYKVHGVWVDGDTDLGIAPGSAVIFTDAVTNAMYGAVDDGADVISLSLGSSSSSTAPWYQAAVDYANAHGVLVVAATGNAGEEAVIWPARCDGVVGVGSYGLAGASGTDIEQSDFTNWGDGLDILAPGRMIYGLTRPDYDEDGSGTSYDEGYMFWQGTSMATPAFAGAAGMLWRFDPDLSADELTSTLFATAEDMGPAGLDPLHGWGAVRPVAAHAAIADSDAPLTSDDALGLYASDPATFTITADDGAGSGIDRIEYLVDGELGVVVEDLASLLPTALVGYQIGPPVVEWPDATVAGVPTFSGLVAAGLWAVHDCDDATGAQQFVDDVSRTGYPEDSSEVDIDGATAYFGTDGVRYATMAYTEGRYAFEVVLTAAGVLPVELFFDAEYAATAFPALPISTTQTVYAATAPVSVTGDGVHTVRYVAYDNAGNVSAPATANLAIDATPPTTTDDAPVGVQTSPVDVALSATDTVSGVDATYYTVNGGAEQTYAAPIPVTADGITTIEYASVDNAGNREATQTATVMLVSDGSSFLTGTVTGHSGSPLPGITAYAYRYTGSTWKNVGGVPTGSDGAYALSGLDPGTYRVGFYDGSGTYIREYYDDATSLSAASDLAVTTATVTSDIDAVLEGIGSITGTVTTEGTPLEGLTVKAYRYENGTWRWRRDATVAADGSYTLTSLREGTYRVSFYDPNKQYIREWYDDTTVISAAVDIPVAAGATVTGISADVAGLGAVSGNVTHDGGPLQGLTVKLYRYNGSIWMWVRDATTNSLGDYSATGLRAGDYRVSFYDPDDRFIREWWNGHLSVYDSDTVVVPAGATATDIDADIEGRDSIGGTVTHQGSPVEGLTIKAYLWDGDSWDWERDTLTRADGTYMLGGLPLGTYRISFYSPDGTYVREWYDDVASISGAQDITVTPTAVTGIDADLIGLGSVSGTVTDAGGGVADIEVKCYRDEGGGTWTWVRDAITASDGTYTATGLREGTYRVSFYDPGGTYIREWYDDQASLGAAQDITVSAGVTVMGIDALIIAGP